MLLPLTINRVCTIDDLYLMPFFCCDIVAMVLQVAGRMRASASGREWRVWSRCPLCRDSSGFAANMPTNRTLSLARAHRKMLQGL